MKYHVIMFGCQMNFADAEKVAGSFESRGYKKTSNINEANAIAVVMCSVRQAAVDRVFGLIEKFKKLKKKPTTILTGCILKKDKKTFSGLFGHVVSINEFLNKKKTLLPSERAYITISNGCNNFCTYCVVPYTRGRLTCISHKKIIQEVKDSINPPAGGGSREIWLLGQNVNDYSSPSDKSIDFPKLLKMVDNLPGNFKIFFMSPNPKNFSDHLIKAMKDCKKFSLYLNLPVQAGDDEILKKMNRPYTAKKYIELVKKIRKALPNINLSTDVIVGFPGETKKQFDNTVKLFKKVKFNIAYINKYSPRWGTAASKMEDNVPWEEKKRREKILIDFVNKK